MQFIIFWLLTLHMLHTKFGKDWPNSSWKEDVNRCQPIAIGHLSDSGDLKRGKIVQMCEKSENNPVYSTLMGWGKEYIHCTPQLDLSIVSILFFQNKICLYVHFYCYLISQKAQDTCSRILEQLSYTINVKMNITKCGTLQYVPHPFILRPEILPVFVVSEDYQGSYSFQVLSSSSG